MDIVDVSQRTNADVIIARTITTWLLLYPSANFRAQVRKSADSPIVYYQWSTEPGNTYTKSVLQVLSAPMTMTATTTSASFTVTVADTSIINIGASISGTNIPAGSYVSEIVNVTTFNFTNPTATAATGSGSVTLTMTDKIIFLKMPRADAIDIGPVTGVYDVLLEDPLSGDEKSLFGGAFVLVEGVTV